MADGTTTRYVAFLRGVSPLNCKMPELKRCIENAGFTNVKTLLSSGNVVFDSVALPPRELEQRLEAAMQQSLTRSFFTIVRPQPALQALVATDPYARFGFPADAKRVVSFMREARAPLRTLPLTEGCATVVEQQDAEIFTAYLPSNEGPVFMKLIESAFGAEVTTRTWDTVRKCAQA
jgi:uncharacterized protein (DUF1697 family)